MIVFKLKTLFVNKHDAIITIMVAFQFLHHRGKYLKKLLPLSSTNLQITQKKTTKKIKKKKNEFILYLSCLDEHNK